MRKLLFVFAFLVTSLSLSAQTERIFNGSVNIYKSSGSGPVYRIEAFFNDIHSYYASDSTQVGDFVYVTNGSSCARLEVTIVHSNSGGIVDLSVNDVDGVMLAPPSGLSGITRETSSGDYPQDIRDIPETLQSCILNQFINLVESNPDGIDSTFTRSDSIFIASGGDEFYAGPATAGSGSTNFDSNRPILRVPTAGINIGGSTVNDWLEYWYFAPPTISIASVTTPVEVGTSNALSISSTTTNSGGATLSNGYLVNTTTNDTLRSFTSNLTADSTVTFTPQQGGSGVYNALTYSFRSTQDWASGSDSGTATSNTRTVQAVYPVFYGMSADTLSSATGTDIYISGLTKLVQTEGNKTVTLSGTNQFIYYAVPASWSDPSLSSIIDPNGFDILGGFTVYDVTVTSTGLVNNYTNVAYKLYKLNNLTTVAASPAQNYTFNR